jgi:2-aminoethylphosphonate transport system ATP-binding protein
VTSAILGAEAAGARVAAQTMSADSTVKFDAVTVAYRGAIVLKPLTLDVAAGEILAMIGPSGSGKTTALRAVAGFVRPASGRIHIGGAGRAELCSVSPHASR